MLHQHGRWKVKKSNFSYVNSSTSVFYKENMQSVLQRKHAKCFKQITIQLQKVDDKSSSRALLIHHVEYANIDAEAKA